MFRLFIRRLILVFPAIYANQMELWLRMENAIHFLGTEKKKNWGLKINDAKTQAEFTSFYNFVYNLKRKSCKHWSHSVTVARRWLCDRLAGSPVFKTSALNHSANPPKNIGTSIDRRAARFARALQNLLCGALLRKSWCGYRLTGDYIKNRLGGGVLLFLNPKDRLDGPAGL